MLALEHLPEPVYQKWITLRRRLRAFATPI
jgi:hypothetical protein